MKKLIPTLFSIFFASIIFAQEVKIADTVLLIDNKPIAYIFADLNTDIHKYNVDIYSLNDSLLIKADVVKFNAPVLELKSFYYYEISFLPLGESISLFTETEVFPVLLAKLIRDYKLIINNRLNKQGVEKFKSTNEGVQAFTAKIKLATTFLDETRFYSEQVVRDRSKPVTLINRRVIMQDGKQIGTVSLYENLQVINQTNQITPVQSQSDYNVMLAYRSIIYFANGRVINYNNAYTPYLRTVRKGELGYTLYEASRNKSIVQGSDEDELLKRICYYVEDFGL